MELASFRIVNGIDLAISEVLDIQGLTKTKN